MMTIEMEQAFRKINQWYGNIGVYRFCRELEDPTLTTGELLDKYFDGCYGSIVERRDVLIHDFDTWIRNKLFRIWGEVFAQYSDVFIQHREIPL